jgi:hypothetical protein
MTKMFRFFKGDTMYELDILTIEKKFETYLLYRSSTKDGVAWLAEFKRGGLQTIALVMHFLYNKDWIDTVGEDQEDELIHLLSKTKLKLFKELFK